MKKNELKIGDKVTFYLTRALSSNTMSYVKSEMFIGNVVKIKNIRVLVETSDEGIVDIKIEAIHKTTIDELVKKTVEKLKQK